MVTSEAWLRLKEMAAYVPLPVIAAGLSVSPLTTGLLAIVGGGVVSVGLGVGVGVMGVGVGVDVDVDVGAGSGVDVGVGAGMSVPDLATKLFHTAIEGASVSLSVGYCAQPLKRVANRAPLCMR